MSLPPSYNNSEEYLEDLLSFLKRYEWIYNYPNTDILINKIFDNFPPHWDNYFRVLNNDDMNLLSNGIAKNSPDDLQTFFNELNKLRPIHVGEVVPEELSIQFYRTSAKKVHEISTFAPFIDKMCEKENITNIIDVGSGLGYLTHLLNKKYQKRVLGIEGCEEKHKQALKNQEDQYKNTKDVVLHVQHYITAESANFLAEKIDELNRDVPWCMVGLHACADLSVNILDIFMNVERIKSLIIMPCCYHRLKVSFNCDTSRMERFENFPKSNLMKRLFAKHDANHFIRRPFLRNACQQTSTTLMDMNENDHNLHAKNVLLRAIIQLVAKQLNVTVRRKKRKSGKLLKKEDDGDFLNIENYVDNLTTLFSFNEDDDDDDEKKLTDKMELNMNDFKEHVKNEWLLYKDKLYLIEILTSLQIAIQNISENLILFDRKIYLNESNKIKCDFYKITNDRVSPRCLALVAIK